MHSSSIFVASLAGAAAATQLLHPDNIAALKRSGVQLQARQTLVPISSDDFENMTSDVTDVEPSDDFKDFQDEQHDELDKLFNDDKDKDVEEATDEEYSSLGNCAGAAFGIILSMPTPPPEIVRDVMANQANGANCDFTTPKDLSSEYKAYTSEVREWFSSMGPEYNKQLKDCGDNAEVTEDDIIPKDCDVNIALGPIALSEMSETTTTGSEGASKTSSDGTVNTGSPVAKPGKSNVSGSESTSDDSDNGGSGDDKSDEKEGSGDEKKEDEDKDEEGAAVRNAGYTFVGLAVAAVAFIL